MQHFKNCFHFLLPLLATTCCCFFSRAYSQSCPANIDFETGTFDGWTCYTGYTQAAGDKNVITLTNSNGPVYTHHTMYTANTGELDPFGGFPVNCPNGSKHSIRLGSTEAGGQAEGVSYDIDIPPTENAYSIVFHYAVVFQAPNHRINEQPRMEIEVSNVTDNEVINCATFSFIAVGSSLPGFEVSHQTDTTIVLFKRWSAVTVDLSGNAGKTIRLFFKTADCTFRRHFGYAYVDVDSDCSGTFTGATYCPDDTVVHVTAPFGYAGYTWYDSSLTRVLGNEQSLTLSPPPPNGTTLAVKLDPFDGYGCQKTLFARLKNTLNVKGDAGADVTSCNLKPVTIGTAPSPGLTYLWSPGAGLNYADVANPMAAPSQTTAYHVITRSIGGGCKTTDTVIVKASAVDSTLQLIGKAAFCFGYGDSAILKINPASHIQWFYNNVPLSGGDDVTWHVEESGTYYALITNTDGCSVSTKKQPVLIEQPVPGIAYPDLYAIINLPLTMQARNIGQTAVWKPATYLNNPESFTPSFRGAVEQLYTIEITTKAGCITVDTQLVKIVKGVEIYVPNAFTPNSDGTNDYLRPVLRGVKSLSYFRVFNRAGQILFESRNVKPGWDGTFKGMQQQAQAVVWALECIGLDGLVYIKKGPSVLLR